MTAGGALAASLVVAGVVSPAWLEHADGRREPLAVGAAVELQERVLTGGEGRALLRLAEGGVVKLGEDALLDVEPAAAGARRTSLYVRRGAFRFSAGGNGPDLSLRAEALAAVASDADVWGRSDPAGDFMLLIAGRVVVTHAGRELALSRPKTMVVAPRGAPAAVKPVSADQVATLLEDTEILAGAGGAWQGGRYRVVVITTVDETYARTLHEQLRESGFPARLRTMDQEGEGSPLFQVDLAQLGGEREARTVARRLQALGYEEARPAR